jgi:hypothetical protein
MKRGLIISCILLFIFCLDFQSYGQKQKPVTQPSKKIPVNFCISPAEVHLYKKINEYRKQYDLPPIPLSRSLCYVAKTHVRDLFFNRPDQGACNFHSWSDKGQWKPFCYPRDEKKNSSVWDKPKEISPYNSKGYEIVYWENNAATIDSILPFWISIDYFNSFMISAGKWLGKNWQAIGIGIYENYAAAWFGEIPDPEGEPWTCGEEPAKKTVIPASKADSARPLPKPAVNSQKKDSSLIVTEKPGIYYIIV